MNINQFLEIIWKKKQTFVSLVIVFLAVAILVSAVQPFKYGSSLNLLTVLSLNGHPYLVHVLSKASIAISAVSIAISEANTSYYL